MSGPATTRSGVILTALLVAGALAVVLVVTTSPVFDLDRHAVPKELVLHLTALLGLSVMLPGWRKLDAGVAETLLGLYVVWSGVSALFATNHWLAFRSFGISFSGFVIFQMARAARRNGLGEEVIDRYFTKTASRIKGVGLDVIARECLERHRRGWPPIKVNGEVLDNGGIYQWRRDGEFHMWNPDTVAKMQHAVRVESFATFKEYTKLVNDEAAHRCTLRGLLKFKAGLRPPVPIGQVEPAKEIVKRFVTGAMSLGSISQEAHENMARAMNEIGGKSNTGEGGEDPVRFVDIRRSSIKQVASGRFGVTSEYLINADEL